MSIRFLQRAASGLITDIQAAVTTTANAIVATGAGGTIDPTFLPTGTGPDIVTCVASEALAAGAIVNLYTNAGATNARNADSATASAGKKASGFVLAAVASSGTASVYRSGQNAQLTGLTLGADYYLGTAGAVTATAPTTSGTTVQFIGTAISATLLDVQIQAPIAIV